MSAGETQSPWYSHRTMFTTNATCVLFGLLKILSVLFVLSVPLWLYPYELPFCLGYTGLILFILILCVYRHSKELSPRGRSVLVTGCDTGFGHGLVKHLDKRGLKVFAGCLHVDGPGADALRLECSDNVHVIGLDISNEDRVRQAHHIVTQHCSDTGLWAIVNNAAIESTGDIEFATMDIFKKTFNVNLFGTVFVTKTFLPLIKKARGRVINVTSIKGRLPYPGTASYTAAKFALDAFSVTLRVEMRKWGVKVIIMEPGNFGFSTGISKNDNLKRLESDSEEMWRNASADTREDYGESYHRYHIDCLKHQPLESTRPSITPVIGAMTEAVLRRYPKMRYMVPGCSLQIDKSAILTAVTHLLPEECLDSLTIWALQWGFPKPQALN